MMGWLGDDALWIFGYGSLIWRPDFDYVESALVRVPGWQRRFWQGSHDHRGLPHAPGRVVTLVQTGAGECRGRAFRIRPTQRDHVLALLDHREKNGYERTWLTVQRQDDAAAVRALTYVAPPHNRAYLGPAPVSEMVAQIAASVGPSGANRDYLLDLDRSLRAHGIEDEHVSELARRLRDQPEPGT